MHTVRRNPPRDAIQRRLEDHTGGRGRDRRAACLRLDFGRRPRDEQLWEPEPAADDAEAC